MEDGQVTMNFSIGSTFRNSKQVFKLIYFKVCEFSHSKRPGVVSQVTESLHKTIVKRRMSHVSGGGSIDLSDTESLQEWINMTGFLCALGGVCLQHRSSAGLATYSPPMGPLNERKGSMISMVSTEGGVETPVSKFIDRLLTLMVCNHEKVGLQIRTNIKDLVGLELSPALYPMLFNKLKNTISKFFDSQGQVSYSCVILFTFVSVLLFPWVTEMDPCLCSVHTSCEQSDCRSTC